MKASKIMRGMSAISVFLLVLSTFGSSIALQYETAINTFLGTSSVEKVTLDEEVVEDTQYYKSEYGELNPENLQKLIQDAYDQAVSEMEEGAVLLKNADGALPLSQDENSVTLFGHSVVQPVYRTNSSGSAAATTGTYVVDLYGALKDAGFEINDTLYQAYKNSSTTRIPEYGGWDPSKDVEANLGEEKIGFYTDQLKASWENAYNDVAIVMFSREGGEDVDMKLDDSEGISQLALHQDEKDLLSMIKDSGKFAKTIVLINSPYHMELQWLDEYDVDACLWISCPGQRGFEGLAHILNGEVNPSGRLADTIAVNSLSAPALVNSGQNTPTWKNLDEVLNSGIVTDDPAQVSYVTVQAEGIYVGYKYYETRYEDLLTHPESGASDGIGAIDGETWKYQNEISYPFGYGLSYTTFEQTLNSVKYNEDTDTFTVEVSVKNTGDVPGKSVVQVYAQTPYGDYEKDNLVEKSAIQLVGFDKVEELEPGKEETVTIDVDRYLLASYDYTNAKGYILSEGDYYLAIGDDSHDALNNILAAKGVDGMVTPSGEEAEGNADNTYSWSYDKIDTDTYKYSKTGEEVTNRFEDSDLNYWNEGAVRYLTRQDWAGSYPTETTLAECTEEMMKILQGDTYEKPEDAPSVSDIKQGVDAGLSFVMMKDVAYDDALWDEYLSQMTIEEMAQELVDQFGTKEIMSVGKPNVATADGCDSMRGTYLAEYGDARDTCLYPSVMILTGTWNKDLIRRRGELMAEEAFYVGTPEIWTGGGNIHRTQFGGRNNEYYSEDSFMTYLASEIELSAMLQRGTQPCIKHYAGNEQEMYRCGLVTFFNEQAFREGSLRGFESTLKNVGSNGTMQAYNRIGLEWASAKQALNNGVLRDEWGFEGHTITDAIVNKDYAMHFTTTLASGTNNYCIDFQNVSAGVIVDAINSNDDGYLLQCLRDAVKNYHYALSRSNLINGLSSNYSIVPVVPWWKNALHYAIYATGFLTAVCVLAWAFAKRKEWNMSKKEISETEKEGESGNE